MIVCLGSIYASDNSQTDLNDVSDDDFDLVEVDDDFEDEELNADSQDDSDDDSDEDWDDDLDDEAITDDVEDNESDYTYSDFDHLKVKITYYLDRYGNCSEHNWTESEEFLNEYQIYLINPSNYTLNESSEGYQTYLKIYDSITSTFGDYNLTQNETAYLKFMVIFYLNHYGNVSANYTWNESESFANYTLPSYLLGAIFKPIAGGNASDIDYYRYSNWISPFILSLDNSTDINNATAINNQASAEVPDSWDFNLIIFLIVVCIIVLFLIL
ncbi:MAG: hypothetical protein IJ258_06340 [Methanobrevibacter sp.]|uniref:hypothetical protein n=1 Tax=Methanobrevibacter sp. TaxID=66852 RepID=UPI0025F48444|nr:hypothetical protein [Methanobrevibacter sp.]MBQ8017709.1 hypothetical protein [Methanobrevibacter sp.]